MVKDKDHQSEAAKKSDAKEPLKDLSGMKTLKTLKTLDFDSSPGFVCDVDTGICGPVDAKKEGKK